MLMLELYNKIRCYLLATHFLPPKESMNAQTKDRNPETTHIHERTDIEYVEKHFHNQIKCKSTKLNTKKKPW